MSSPFKPDIPPHVAAITATLDPELKRSIKSAIQAIAADPGFGEPLRRELEGLWKYRVRRFRIVYAIDRKTRTVRLMAIGHRQNVYEELAARKAEKQVSKKGTEKAGVSRRKGK